MDEEKLDRIEAKLDLIINILQTIDTNTEPSAANHFVEYLLNVGGDLTGDLLLRNRIK